MKVFVLLIIFIESTHAILPLESNLNPDPEVNVFLYPPTTGKWGKLEKCPAGKVTIGMQTKTKPKKTEGNGAWLNGIKFYCTTPRTSKPEFTFLWSSNYPTIQSSVGREGNWAETSECEGVMVGFQLTGLDMTIQDSASKNLIIFCTNGGYTDSQSDKTKPKKCPTGMAVCGLQTQVHEIASDESSLLNIGVKCCLIDPKYF